MHHEVGKMAVKNSCHGPFCTNDFWYDEFLACELLRDRGCFRQNQGREQMVHSNWVLRGEFKYIFTNMLAGCIETPRIITTLGGFSTPGLKVEREGTVTRNQSGKGYDPQWKEALSPYPSWGD